MSEHLRSIAGRCTTVFEGSRARKQHGDMLVVVKPDGTVLVHDANGYQPVAWLTRAESLSISEDTITAQDGDQSLQVTIHDEHLRNLSPTAEAGVPVGDCPDCDDALVRASGSVSCLCCGEEYGLPAKATVLEESCQDCGLPKFRVERGETFDVCLDWSCDSLDERIQDVFDGKWDCPDCDGALDVLRRGGLLLGCERYPDCETGFAFPAGSHDGECDCGLPAFKTATGRRCLDSTCEQAKG